MQCCEILKERTSEKMEWLDRMLVRLNHQGYRFFDIGEDIAKSKINISYPRVLLLHL